ncbi:MAG TPA: autotransporter-associated beta strand repeat-containing protein [Candidatus Acidoferrales bacterium]|nr:autotransporter-associated beta strand repeat-containing protein [Candidatus Acidoferrales bacterium]
MSNDENGQSETSPSPNSSCRAPLIPNKARKRFTIRLVWCLCLAVSIGSESVQATVFSWSGAGGNVSWTTAANWHGSIPTSGADLVFPASVPTLANVNDLAAGTEFNSITISGNGYSLSGNAIVLGNAAGSGSLTLNSGLTGNIAFNIQLGAPGAGQQFFIVNSAANLTLSGQLSGTTGVELTKQGTGTLVLSGNNSAFTGPIFIPASSGMLTIANANALGGLSAGTIVGANSQLQVATVSGAIQEGLDLNGFGVANDGALLNLAGNNVWSGGITLDSDSAIGASAGALNITGQIGDLGSGHNLTKQGGGVVLFSNPNGNTYRGVTVINNGTLLVNNTNGSATGANAVTVASSIVGHGVLGGAGIIGGPVTVQSGAMIASPVNSGTLAFTGAVTNNGTIIASNGCVIAFFGPVLNNGVITTSGGTIRFYSTLTNNGTIPPYSILSLPVRVGNDAQVAWTGLAGSNYVLQAATNLGNAGGAFHDISPVITVQGSGEGVTNYLDAGAFTNSTIQFYRVRSSP